MDPLEQWAKAVVAVGVRRAGHAAVETTRTYAEGSRPVRFAGIYGTAFVVDETRLLITCLHVTNSLNLKLGDEIAVGVGSPVAWRYVAEIQTQHSGS